jgi:Fic family protein
MSGAITEWDLLDALHAEYLEKERREGDFTRKEWQARYKITESQAFRELDALVGAGKLTKRTGRSDGRECDLYHVA